MSSLDIYLPLFSVTVTSDTATIYGETYPALTGDATVDVDISTALMQNLFQFQSDSTDITDVSVNDLKYKVVYSSASPILPLGVDIDTSSNVAVGAIASNSGLNYNLTYDYVRFLAQSLFGTHLGTDLFNNEAAIRSSLNLKFKTALDTMLTTDNGVVKTSADDTYMRGALLQILNYLPERLSDITTLQVGADGSGQMWYKIPFVAGDKIYFNLTVQPAVDQSSATTGATVNNRVYLVRGTLV
jgi:hypothetical protein